MSLLLRLVATRSTASQICSVIRGRGGTRPYQVKGFNARIFRRILPLILVWPWLGGAAGFTFFEPVKPPRPQQVMVHRGEARQAPENTRAAIQRCIDDAL